MKTTLLFFFILFCLFTSCDNSIDCTATSTTSGTITLQTRTAGIETFEFDEIDYTIFQQQGLFVFKDGKLIKQTVQSDIVNFKIKETSK